MDPNETLKSAREALERCENPKRLVNLDDMLYDMETALECFEELDEWLSMGGCLPDAWKPGNVSLHDDLP